MLTKDEIIMAEELTDKLWNQGDLIAKVLCGMTKDEFFENVEFLPMPTGEKGIAITIHNGGFGEWQTRVEWFPEEYLSKSEDELVIELYRRREDEKRRREAEELAEKEAKEREEEEARKKRYQMFLELKKEFEGKKDSKVAGKPKKESVYVCKCAESYYDDYVNCMVCHSKNSKLQICDCKWIYAQQFCPFYEKGELRGKWVIGDEEKLAAEEFKKKFESK